MYISYSKSLAFAALALVSVHQSESFLCEIKDVVAIGNEPITVGGLFRHYVVHTIACEWAEKNLPESELFALGSAKLNASEVWETLAHMSVEALYENYAKGAKADPGRVAKLVVYGAGVHKIVAEVWHALGLDSYFSKEVKENYNKFGSCYMEAVFAHILDKNLQEAQAYFVKK